MNNYPIIASLTKEEQIPALLNSSLNRVNLMTGHIGNLRSIMEQLHEAKNEFMFM